MQIKRIGYHVRGFGRITDYALRWAYMITEKAKHKARVLAFWKKHGIEATGEAFQVKRRTLYLWKSQLKSSEGKLESLNEKSKRPKSVRKRNWPENILSEIRRFREEHPNLSSPKIALLLTKVSSLQDIELPKARTIARIIADDPYKMRTFPQRLDIMERLF